MLLRDLVLEAALTPMVAEDDWEALRAGFEAIADALIEIDYRFGHPETVEHFVTLCPMAFNNRGTYWLQDQQQIANPYYGHKMLRCGSVTDSIPPTSESGS